MGRRARTVAQYLLVGGLLALSRDAFGVAPLAGEKWEVLSLVTGFHSVALKAKWLEARVLEAEASSVAMDPVRLYLVVTNNGTSDLKEHVWEVPRQVSKVRKMIPTPCGLDLFVEVDQLTDGPSMKAIPKKLQLCFLSSAGELEEGLSFKEHAMGRAATPANKALQTDGASRRR